MHKLMFIHYLIIRSYLYDGSISGCGYVIALVFFTLVYVYLVINEEDPCYLGCEMMEFDN